MDMKTGLLLKTDGSISNYTLDMAPLTNNIGELLDDKITFLGQLVREPMKCNAIIMYSKNTKQRKLPLNKCKLPAPFQDETIYGDIFIICMDEESEPQNFTIDDYNEYSIN